MTEPGLYSMRKRENMQNMHFFPKDNHIHDALGKQMGLWLGNSTHFM